MGDMAERSYGVLLTREVRWFVFGRLPDEVETWFAAMEGEMLAEQRIDSYVPQYARRDIGLKLRGADTIDIKFLADRREGLEIATGLVGNVEDWLKVSDAATGEEYGFDADSVDVTKHLTERRYLIAAGSDFDGEAGCKIELGAIRLGAVEAWTLCLETFGPVGMLAECFSAGVDGLRSASPIPGVRLSPEKSFGYPGFISRVLDD